MAKRVGALPSDLKQSNRSQILGVFAKQQICSALEIAVQTGISRQTVKKCIDFYLTEGVLESCGKGESTENGGKKPDLYRLYSGIRVLSIGLYHHNIELTLFSVSGEKLAFWRSDAQEFPCLDTILNCIREGWKSVEPANTDGTLLALEMAGPVGYSEENYIMDSTPYPQWPKKDYRRDMNAAIREIIPDVNLIMLTTDGTAAGAALLQRDPAKYSNSTYVTFYTGTGIGGSIYKASVPESGRFPPVGSMGHIIVDPNDPEACLCGNHGCLERQVSLTRMRQRMSRDMQVYRESFVGNIPIEELVYADVFRGSRAGDMLCQKESQRSAHFFSAAINNIILLTWPDYIVFQGVFAEADPIFEKELINRIGAMKMFRSFEGKICYDHFPLNESEALGSFYRVRKTLLENFAYCN